MFVININSQSKAAKWNEVPYIHPKKKKILDFLTTWYLSIPWWFFDNFKFEKTLLLKLGQIFDEVAKLGKSTQDTYNWGGQLIL